MSLRFLDLYPEKAQYRPGEEVGIIAEIEGPDRGAEPVTVELSVQDLAMVVESTSREAVAAAGVVHRIRMVLAGRTAGLRGYGVDACLSSGAEIIDRLSTAFDVADSLGQAPRYGFLADFGPDSLSDEEDVTWLCRLHLNVAQFYDWMYRHDTLIPPGDEFCDPMGKPKSLRAVTGKLSRCHERGIRGIAYGAVYAATTGFANDHPGWTLRDGGGTPITFADRFAIMSIAPDSPWHEHIIGQFGRAISEIGFDGIHLDTYGFPKTAVSVVAGAPRVERLDEQFPVLIRGVRERLRELRPDVCLIFNNVTNWPVATTAPSDLDAVYVEVWPPYERYGQIAEIVRQARLSGSGKPVILAAYLSPFATAEGGTEKDPSAEASATSAASAFKLAWGVIAAHGAFSMLLGGRHGVLTRGYYPDYARIPERDVRTVRNYADFVVRYSALLFDPELHDVSMTHAGGDSREYRFTGCAVSPYCQPGKVWCVIRESRTWKTVSFINLDGVSDDLWNSPKETPRVVKNLEVSIEVVEPVRAVFATSPDSDGGRPRGLPYHLELGPLGLRLRVRVPDIAVWTLLAVEVGPDAADDRADRGRASEAVHESRAGRSFP